jgi:hypothetical protein
MANPPDMVESSSSKRGRRATKGRSSPVRGGGVGRLRWSGKSATPRRASSKWVGALGPAEEERGRLVRSGDGELVTEIGAEAVASLPADGEAKDADKMHGEGPFYTCVGGGWMG